MKFVKVLILMLIFLNLPGFFLARINAIAGSVLSYSTFILIIVYYLFNKQEKPLIDFIILGIMYFFISALVDVQNDQILYMVFIKYFIFILMGAKVVKDATTIEIYLILLLGSLSIIFDLIFIAGIEGRFSGFYLNPNFAGFACLIGYCMSYSVEDKKLKIIGQVLFSIAGIVTFSRTFLIIWILVNILSLTIQIKNIYKIIAAVFFISLFLTLGDKLNFNQKRLDIFSSLFKGKVNEDLGEDSRTEVWASYYDKISERPIFGNGYLSLSGKTTGEGENAISIQGVHNTFLMILGEAGIIVFIFFLYIYGRILYYSCKAFIINPLYFLLSISLLLFMLTGHNYFDNYFMLFVSIWLYLKVINKKIGLRHKVFIKTIASKRSSILLKQNKFRP